MKRILSLIIFLAVFMNSFTFVYADTPAMERLAGLGIMQGDEGGFRLEDELTRAEFCTLVARLLKLGGYPACDTGFEDVHEGHWASGSIGALYSMGYINGNGDGTFGPDNNITFPEAVKVLVCAVGYGAVLSGTDSYPSGYLSAASRLGITSGLTDDGNAITRLTAAELIDNTLDIVPLDMNYGTGDYEINSENLTLYELLLRGDDMIEFEGIMISGEYASIEEENYPIDKNYLTIDVSDSGDENEILGKTIFKTSKPYNEYLGYYVNGYAKKTNSRYEIVSLTASGDYNESITVDAEDAVVSENYMEFWIDNRDKTDKVSFETDVIYMYNGRICKNITNEDKVIHNGRYILLDNDNNKKADIVFIEEYESFVAERVNTEQQALYFANKQIFRGKNNITVSDEEEIYEITGKDGEAVGFDYIMPGFGITIMQSMDGIYTKIMVSDRSVSGKVEGISENENTVVIDDEEYKLALGTDGKPYIDIELSDEADFVLDTFGRIIDVNGDKTSKLKYGYVVAVKTGKGLDDDLTLKLVAGAEPQRQEEIKNGDVKVSYLFQNKEMLELKLSEKAVCYVTEEAINSSEHYVQIFREVTADRANLLNTIIGYTVNSEGEINKIYMYSVPLNDSSLGNSEFNADILSFGGEATGNVTGRGYATNSATRFICVPNHASPSDDDYFVQLEIDDEASGNYVYGIKSFFVDTASDLNYEEEKEIQNGQPVDVLLIRAEMQADNPPPVSQDADICIIGRISAVLGENGDDEGNEVFRLELLNGDEKLTEYTASSGKAYDIASTLIKGDLIRYTKDGFGRIARIELVGHVQGLDADLEPGDNREHDYRQEGSMIYGRARSIERELYYYNYNEIVDVIYLGLSEDLTRKIRVPVTDGPPLYLYEPKSGWIYSATSDDILTGESSICAYTDDDGRIAAVVIINE